VISVLIFWHNPVSGIEYHDKCVLLLSENLFSNELFPKGSFPKEHFSRESLMQLNSIAELIADIRAGKMVILMDDEDRENEGDVIMAAEHVTTEAINFMARFARGLICLPMTRERCQHLRLPLMVEENHSGFGTKFTVSIEAATGVTTGISAADRARTVQAAVAKNATASDIVQPGHVFPLVAEPGGVLRRAGHTEAACDLASLAGCEPAGVICEVMNDDGSMARRPDLEAFAKAHGLKMGTIADLIQYRLHHEATIERVSDHEVETWYGKFRLFSYRDKLDALTHLALVKGEIKAGEEVPVRVHQIDPIRDLISAKLQGNTSWNLYSVMRYLARCETGVVIILGQDYDSASMADRIEAFFAGEVKPVQSEGPAWRNVGTGSQILQDLGVTRMKLLSSPLRFNALSGFGLEITEYVDAK
jgi:3,4-dihydroxy 2-butanone 4-phosphate synthase/GTP cyclohydrolase II